MPIPVRGRRLRAILAIVTIATLLTMPFQAFAAKGGKLEATVNPLVLTVTPGNLLAFEASFTNTSGSPMPHFSFNGVAAGMELHQFYVFAFPPASCSDSIGTDSLVCAYGTLPVDETAKLILAFKVPNSFTGSEVPFRGTFSADSNSKGRPNANQREHWSKTVSVDTIVGNPDAFATWQPPDELGTWEFGTTQQTKVTGPLRSQGYIVELYHTDETFECTGQGWGMTIDMDVAGGGPVEIVVTFAREPGLTPQQLRIMHILDTDECIEILSAADCMTTSATCFVAYWVGSGSNRQVEAFIRIPHTSRAKGF